MYKHILIPTDGSARSRRAIRAGIALAAVLRAKVSGVFAGPPATPVLFRNLMPVGYVTPRRHARLTAQAAARALGEIEEAARRAGVACRCERVTSDFPADAILQVARRARCDLIVMASHGRRGVASLLLGSETQKVLAGSRLPVLVCR